MLAHTEMRRSRVLVAAAGLLFGLLTLWLRMAWLQLVLHGHYAERAEEIQEQRVLLKPVRGNLLDRHGRVLAHDLLTYTLSAVPREMSDPRGAARAVARILGREPRSVTREFEQHPRYLTLARHLSPADADAIAGLHEHGFYLASETQREYPLGDAACEILGATDVDDDGIAGLELQFDDDLRGQAGWSNRLRWGNGSSQELPGGLRREAVDGHHVVLTLDYELQSIVEHRLAAAVDSMHADRGFALFMDPTTGEVLAAACAPHAGPGQGRNWNFTDQYEPGSTFKIVTAGGALEEGVASPGEWFEAAAGGMAVLAGAHIHDTHPAARYTFFGAMQHSSNIVMGKIGMLLGPERLYRYATALGFGSLTGIEFPGEAGGRLRSPDHWVPRSTPTVAIGHELSVTPLQLVLAYSAVANGGVLMRPMIVREVRDDAGHVLRHNSPEAVQRVFTEHTTATLRRMLQAVVDSGTATAAAVPGLTIAGKTGTAQKYDPDVRGYGIGKYIASFVGFAPVENPRIVGVVVIDEPKGARYYGGQVAAPVFREALVDLRSLPHGPLAPDPGQVALRPPAPAPVTVPDLRLLPPAVIESRLAGAGLHAIFHGHGPRALSQQPPADQALERGSVVDVWLSTPEDSALATLPDLVGRVVRDALRELGRREIPAQVLGRGTVVRQAPSPGTPLPLNGPCVLWCEPRAVTAEPAAPDVPAIPAAAEPQARLEHPAFRPHASGHAP
jgi:cell division protein FtsI/penicillin-binding protein 2